MENNKNIKICHVQNSDKEFWFSLDKHFSETEFEKKVRYKQGYVLFVDDLPIGILRYNLFWDNTPFCTLLYISEKYQRTGYGKRLMDFWESEMLSLGYDWILVSTQSDEDAQHFYRALGYEDCGSLIAPDQPMELFLSKHLK
ncbi:MAG: GNAT family N-acetyltransferase [Clostridiales bacterium]|nr:GNAT family N-acetyltransferase [Clostridiales bacterium]